MLVDHTSQRLKRLAQTIVAMWVCALCLLGCSPPPNSSRPLPKVDAAEKVPIKAPVEKPAVQPPDADPTAVANSIDPTAQLPPATALELRHEASELAQQLVDRFPNNADALEIKARFLMLFGETQAAKECWLEAIRLIPDYAYALHGLGKIAMLDSHYEEAIDLLSRSLPKQPGVAEPVHNLADAYTKLARLDEAIETLRTFAEANSHSALTWLLLGQAYQAKQQYEQAEQAFRSALQLAPGTTRAEQGLATVLIRLGKRDEATKLLADLRSRETGDNKNRPPEQVFQDEMKECSQRFLGVAEFYSSHHDLREAERVARRALVLDPQNLKAKSMLGNLYQQQGRLPEAIALVREMSQAEPSNASWPFTLGVLLAQSGEMKAAGEQYREVLRLAPQNPLG